MGKPIESEVKLQCKDLGVLKSAHPALKWTLVRPRHFEDNFVFELPQDALANRGSILRLRIADGAATLTYKGMIPASETSQIKVREELETRVERPETLALVFERLGMRRAFRYQKYRTVYRLEVDRSEVLAMYDETPMGNFLELEGEEELVIAAATELGYRRSEYVNVSYIGMQAAFCRARGVPLQDLVFEEAGREGSDRSRSATAGGASWTAAGEAQTPDARVARDPGPAPGSR
jgi:adenylate cyclase class 2